MKICPNCKKNNDADAVFCGHCAAHFPPSHWSCLGCGVKVANEFDICWKCGTGKDGSDPDKSFLETKKEAVTLPDGTERKDEPDTCVSCRYFDDTDTLACKCRRYPPENDEPRYPLVTGQDWCGEHTENE